VGHPHIPLGRNFVKQLTSEVNGCDAFLAVIGPNWLDARDEHGNRRLDDPNDFVRIEVGAALQRDIPVVPILLDGAKMPSADQLPSDLQELSFRGGLDLRHSSFDADVSRLIRELKQLPQWASKTPATIAKRILDFIICRGPYPHGVSIWSTFILPEPSFN
jgi:TIR domain